MAWALPWRKNSSPSARANSTEDLRAAHPMKRLGTIDEPRNAAVFFMAPGCGWMTGQIVMLDGAHHRAHGSVYSPLLNLGADEWTAITERIRGQDAADKAKRTTA